MKEFTEKQLKELCGQITPLDTAAMDDCRRRWDGIAKPLDGLGQLESMLVTVAGIQQQADIRLSKKAVVVFCSDNGIVEEGVTQTDSSVTAVVAANFAKGVASVNRIAAVANAEVIPVDVGVIGEIDEPGVIDRKVSPGTKNFLKEPAMTKMQALQAIDTGINMAQELKRAGYHILAAGEMGIGNTTTSSALAAVMLNLPVEQVTGRGAGLSDHGLERKIAVIKAGIARYQPSAKQPLELLATLGGYDIAAMTGLFLGGAIYRIPVVLDGMIAATAALLARAFCGLVPAYLIPSHLGKEPVCRIALKQLQLEPVIHAGLALGEGTGAAMLFPLLDMAAAIYQENQTFEENNIEAYQKFEASE